MRRRRRTATLVLRYLAVRSGMSAYIHIIFSVKNCPHRIVVVRIFVHDTFIAACMSYMPLHKNLCLAQSQRCATVALLHHYSGKSLWEHSFLLRLTPQCGGRIRAARLKLTGTVSQDVFECCLLRCTLKFIAYVCFDLIKSLSAVSLISLLTSTHMTKASSASVDSTTLSMKVNGDINFGVVHGLWPTAVTDGGRDDRSRYRIYFYSRRPRRASGLGVKRDYWAHECLASTQAASFLHDTRGVYWKDLDILTSLLARMIGPNPYDDEHFSKELSGHISGGSELLWRPLKELSQWSTHK